MNKLTEGKKLDMVCEKFGSLKHPNPPMRVDWMVSVAWNLLFERKITGDTCLVYLEAENGIGIADRGVKGYTPTPCCIADGVNGREAVQWFNLHILDIDHREAYKIVLSTFGGIQ